MYIIIYLHCDGYMVIYGSFSNIQNEYEPWIHHWIINNGECFTIVGLIFSDSRNPFVEYALQYSVAAAYANFDSDKKDLLHKLLLKGTVDALLRLSS